MVSKVTPDTMLSCSRLPAVMGFSRYQTPSDELDISINAIKGIEREFSGNEAMGWGDRLEVINLVESAKRLQLSDLVTDHPEARYHEYLPLCCSLDATADGRGQVITNDPDNGIYVVGQDSITLDGVGVLEAKLTSVAPEETPALYRGPIQLQGQMDIVKAKWGAVCVLYRGVELRIFLFAPHAGTVQMIADAAMKFQAKLNQFKEDGTIDYYPPAEGEKWWADRGAFPTDRAPIELGKEVEELAEKVYGDRQLIKKMEAELERNEEALKAALGACEYGSTSRFQISRPTRTYKAQPEKVVPARPGYTIRQSSVSIKEIKQ